MKVYVNTYKRQKEGHSSIALDLSEFKDEKDALEYCEAVLKAPVDCFQYDGYPDWMMNQVDLYPGIVQWTKLNPSEQAMLEAYTRLVPVADLYDMSVERLQSDANRVYYGRFFSLLEFAIEQYGDSWDIPTHVAEYVNWGMVADDLSKYRGYSYDFVSGHVFQIGRGL